MGARRPAALLAAGLALFAGVAAGPVQAAPATDATIDIVGPDEVVFDSAKDGCTPDDVPDMDPHAIRNDKGEVLVFTLNFQNRPLRGPDLAHLRIDCRVALPSANDANPARYDDRRYLATAWTRDGRVLDALVHHEYHADLHGTCAVSDTLGCWYNTITAFRSTDGGASFRPMQPAVVAAAPFRQTVEQGRHRGFFAPSNIVTDSGAAYFLGSTTGWSGQPFGACLFRSANPDKPGSWRAYDGHAFTIAYSDPYGPHPREPKACAPVAPFGFPVGAVLRQRGSDLWVAVFMASKTQAAFPVDGFYYAVGRDLLHWSSPKLLMPGQTIMSDLCHGGRTIIAYPSILDEHATTRIFEDIGEEAYLYYTRADVEGCGTGRRVLLRRKITVVPHR